MIDPIHEGGGGKRAWTLCFAQGNKGTKCFSFTPGFADFTEYLICTAAHPAACLSPSCLALASEHQRCSCISVSGRMVAIQGNLQLGQFVFLLLSFPPFCQAPSPSPLSLFPSVTPSLSPSIPSTAVILARQALISALFIIVGALDQASDCSSL